MIIQGNVIKQTDTGAAALVVVAGGLLLALGLGFGCGERLHRFDKMKEFVATYLDLTEGQKAQAEQIFSGAREAAKPLTAQLKEGREALMNAVKTGDGQKIDRLPNPRALLSAA